MTIDGGITPGGFVDLSVSVAERFDKTRKMPAPRAREAYALPRLLLAPARRRLPCHCCLHFGHAAGRGIGRRQQSPIAAALPNRHQL